MTFLKRNKTGFWLLASIAVILAFVIHWRTSGGQNAGDFEVKKANYRLEDGQLDEALVEFNRALEKDPEHLGAYLGLGVTWLQRQEFEKAIVFFDEAIALDSEFAVAYANRGIARDQLGQYQQACDDYQRALDLDEKLSEGPGWLWRFMRNVNEAPPTIKDRVLYLRQELKKPVDQRVLHVAEADEKQRMYKAN